MELRPTTAGDLPALHAIFLEAIAGVYRPLGLAPPSPALEVFANQQEHVLRTGASMLAESNGRPVGFGSAWSRGRDWFLASLFVSGMAQGAGVGSALLDSLWDGRAVRRRTITDAVQPVSNALYARRGLVPTTPVLVFTGRPSPAGRPELAGRPPAESSPGECSPTEVDLAAYGFDRSVDHAYWQRHARRTAWPGAWSYAFPGGSIGPVAGVDPASAAAALAGELARSGGPVTLRIPGTARSLVDVALAAGLRLTATPGLLLTSDDVPPPRALAFGGYTLC